MNNRKQLALLVTIKANRMPLGGFVLKYAPKERKIGLLDLAACVNALSVNDWSTEDQVINYLKDCLNLDGDIRSVFGFFGLTENQSLQVVTNDEKVKELINLLKQDFILEHLDIDATGAKPADSLYNNNFQNIKLSFYDNNLEPANILDYVQTVFDVHQPNMGQWLSRIVTFLNFFGVHLEKPNKCLFDKDYLNGVLSLMQDE